MLVDLFDLVGCTDCSLSLPPFKCSKILSISIPYSLSGSVSDSKHLILSGDYGFYLDANFAKAVKFAISLDTLPKNAEYFEVPQDEELRRLIVHGLLHLKGYDHGEEHVEKGVELSCEMLKLQKKIMTALNKESII